MENNEGSQEEQKEQRRVIYDNKTLSIHCPVELAHDFIDFANQNFYGKQYIALKELLRTWREARQLAYMQADIRELQEVVQDLAKEKEITKEASVVKKKTIKTMGTELEGE